MNSIGKLHIIPDFVLVASILLRKSENPKSIYGVLIVNWKKLFLAGAVFSCALAFAVGREFTLARERWRPDASRETVRNGKSDLQLDEELFAIDVGKLRRSLRDQSRQGQVEQLRQSVIQEWHQIVVDRGRAETNRWKRTLNLANRRRQRIAPRG